MSSIKCSFTCICEIFWPLNPSTTTVYARSAFYSSLHFTLSLQSAFYTQSAVYPWSAVCSPQSTFYTDRFCIRSNGSGYPFERELSSPRTTQAIPAFEKNCHPFERLGLSVGKKCLPFERLGSIRSKKIVIRLNGSTSYPLKTIVSPATVPNHFFYPNGV